MPWFTMAKKASPLRIRMPPTPSHFQATARPMTIASMATDRRFTFKGWLIEFGTPSPRALATIRARILVPRGRKGNYVRDLNVAVDRFDL